MDVNERASRLRELIYKFGKNRNIGCEKKGHIRSHDLMFIRSILTINDGDLVKMSQLSQHFEISAPAISQLARRLEKAGYIERVIKDEDRRSVYIKVSETGKKDVADAEKMMNQAIVDIIEYLGNDDYDDLVRVLARIEEYMKDKRKVDKGC